MVENRSGAGGNIGVEAVAKAADPHVLLIGGKGPYRGFPPAVTDMLAGNIDTMFAIIPAVLPHVRAGKMKGLAVTGLKKSDSAPDTPSVAELGFPQLESLAWNGLLAPAGTPPAVVSRLSAETISAMRHP